MDCYEIYDNQKLAQCPKSTCAGKVVDIDELMIPAIVTLNKKGYHTSGCCSSHEFGFNLTNNMYGAKNTWINFKPSVLTLPPAPEGFELVRIGTGKGDGRHILRLERENPIWYAEPSVTDRQQRIFNGIVSLTKWAEKLPEKIPAEKIALRDVYNAIPKDAKHGDSFGITDKILINLIIRDDGENVEGLEIYDGFRNIVADVYFRIKKIDEKLHVLKNPVLHFFKNDALLYSFERPIEYTIDRFRYTIDDEDHAKYITAILCEFVNKYKD
jgi:hypothetical protein